MDRNCDGCTKCCEGYLTANIYGYKMYPGKPCHFKSNNGCSIYSNRPYNPCKGFKCSWKHNRKIPINLKPDQIDMIMVDGQIDNISYVTIVPAGKEISLEVLDWAVGAVNSGDVNNIVYQFNGQKKIISHDPEFISKYTEQTSNKD